MTANPFLPYAKPSLNSSDIEKVTQALSSPVITRGPLVEEFEKEIAKKCGAQFAIAFNSGSSALAGAFYAAQVSTLDRIYTTPNTFVSTIGGAIQRGGKPVFIDIDLSTGNLDLSQLKFNVNQPSSRGRPIIVPVHFAGLAVDMESLDLSLAVPEAIVIEDAAHAIGSSYPRNGPMVGSCAFSQMTVFSFHPAKTITTGEGGMVTTNSQEFDRLLRLFRNNGIERDPLYVEEVAYPGYYEVLDVTSNYHFTEFQAALGLSQLKRLPEFVEKRRSLVRRYRELLKNVPHLKMLTAEFDEMSAPHLFVVLIDFLKVGMARSELMNALQAKGIGTQVHYIPLYRHPYFKKECGDVKEYFPQTETYYSQALTLPLFYEMEMKDVERVVGTLREMIVK